MIIQKSVWNLFQSDKTFLFYYYFEYPLKLNFYRTYYYLTLWNSNPISVDLAISVLSLIIQN